MDVRVNWIFNDRLWMFLNRVNNFKVIILRVVYETIFDETNKKRKIPGDGYWIRKDIDDETISVLEARKFRRQGNRLSLIPKAPHFDRKSL